MEKKRNRAKCKKCGDILESFHMDDYVKCSCNEISISGGTDRYYCAANDWNNFIRLDDDDTEITVVVVEEKEKSNDDSGRLKITSIGKHEKLQMLKNFISSFDKLPQHEQFSFVTQSELNSVSSLILSIFEELIDD